MASKKSSEFGEARKSLYSHFRESHLQRQPQVQLTPSPGKKETVVPLEGSVRLQALDELDVLDSPPSRTFQVLVDLANKFLGTPVSLISLVTDDRQFFLSSSGLGEPWASCRETPLSHSFCQHVVKRNEPLVVTDAEDHELVKENLAVDALGVKAYLGAPIVMPDGNVIGSFCAINDSPRSWSREDLEILEKLVELTVVELELRKAAQQRQEILENRLSQAQKMQAIGQLVGGVAHDFNNVLGAIQIQTDLLEARLQDKSAEQVNQIRATISSAKSIVQQLLNWSRPSEGKRSPASLNQIVTNALPLISTFSTKFVEIEFNPNPCNDTILADANKINQILLNLCSNAAYAMKAKGGKILIEVEAGKADSEKSELLELKEDNYVKLKVSDQGCGIPRELLPRIHDPYFTTKPVGEGTGLGLWTVFGLVREHGGQVHVESVERQGTSIEIFFPHDTGTPNTSTALPTARPTVTDGLECGLRLLIVDDEAVITDGLKNMFELSGHLASAFSNSCEALKAFADSPTEFDLVLTDQVMPAMSGEELISEVKKIRPDIPIILCSGLQRVFSEERL